jgi:hypothetical protein
MNPEQRMTELVNESKIVIGSETDKRILGDALDYVGQLEQKQSTDGQPNMWRTIMKSRKTKLTAAAAVVVAALIVVSQLGGSGVVWAEVAGNVGRALTYTCYVQLKIVARENVPVDVEADIEAAVYGSTEHGQKQDVSLDGTLVKHTYFLRAQSAEIDVMPAEKKYRRKVLTAEDISRSSNIRNWGLEELTASMLRELRSLIHVYARLRFLSRA